MNQRSYDVDQFVNGYLMRRGNQSNTAISQFCRRKARRMRKFHKQEQYKYWADFFQSRRNVGPVHVQELNPITVAIENLLTEVAARIPAQVATSTTTRRGNPEMNYVLRRYQPNRNSVPSPTRSTSKRHRPVDIVIKCPTCRHSCKKHRIYPLFGITPVPECPVCTEPKVNRIFSCGHFICDACIEQMSKQSTAE